MSIFRFQFVSPMWDETRMLVEHCVIPIRVDASDADEAMRKVSKALTDLISSTKVPPSPDPDAEDYGGLFPWMYDKPEEKKP